MSLEHLFTEFLVASILDSVQLESVGVGVDVVLLGEQVRNWVESSDDAEDHADDDKGVWHLVSSKEGDVLCHIVGHLRSR